MKKKMSFEKKVFEKLEGKQKKKKGEIKKKYNN